MNEDKKIILGIVLFLILAAVINAYGIIWLRNLLLIGLFLTWPITIFLLLLSS